MARPPGECPLEVFEWDAVERRGEPLHPEVGERHGCVAMGRKQRGNGVRKREAATGAPDGEHCRASVVARRGEQCPDETIVADVRQRDLWAGVASFLGA